MIRFLYQQTCVVSTLSQDLVLRWNAQIVVLWRWDEWGAAAATYRTIVFHCFDAVEQWYTVYEILLYVGYIRERYVCVGPNLTLLESFRNFAVVDSARTQLVVAIQLLFIASFFCYEYPVHVILASGSGITKASTGLSIRTLATCVVV